MKKLIILLVSVFVLTIPFNTAYAADKAQTDSKAKKAVIKAQLQAKKDDLKLQRAENDKLRSSIKTKHQEIKAKVKELKKASDDASKAKLTAIKAQLATLSTSKEALKELKGAGKPIWAQFKTNVKNANIDGAMANLNSISLIKSSRHEALIKINATLDSIMGMLQ